MIDSSARSPWWNVPLALDQAGAYIKETPCSLMDYLASYQARRQDLLL